MGHHVLQAHGAGDEAHRVARARKREDRAGGEVQPAAALPLAAVPVRSVRLGAGPVRRAMVRVEVLVNGLVESGDAVVDLDAVVLAPLLWSGEAGHIRHTPAGHLDAQRMPRDADPVRRLDLRLPPGSYHG